MPASPKSPNFHYLAEHDVLLVRYGAMGERYFATDPNTALIKLRQFAEVMIKEAAALSNVYTQRTFVDTQKALADRGVLTPKVDRLVSGIRRAGNEAVHDNAGTRREALHQLKMARILGIWFHRVFGSDPNFNPGPFIPPPDPVAEAEREEGLAEELEALRKQLLQAQEAAQNATLTAAEEAKQRAEAERSAKEAYEELETVLELAAETEQQSQAAMAAFEDRMAAVQTESTQAPLGTIEATLARARQASNTLDMTEADTRQLIDRQLRDAGWEVDSLLLKHARGTRPQKGRHLAIAEWPTETGPADYVLFIGLTPVAIVEAKRMASDVPARIEQAKRYSRGFQFKGELKRPGGPWNKDRIPFLFATNGRPFLRQLLNASGIWFLDARLSTNHPRALEGWYTPDGLEKLLAQDIAAADQRLANRPSDYLPLRHYQQQAIAAVEGAIANGQREILLAMATGTGKTRTTIGLVYRLVAAGRFRRVLFLVDRTSLGEQAHDSFKSLKLEQQKSFTEIYDVKALKDIHPDGDTRLQLATVQGLVKRVLYDDNPPPVDQYDCIVIDECHRGYNLDAELSDLELTFRSEAHYISTYRRVLDHFDAVKIGLTATPALHTTEIFGDPVFTYSYRQAVIEGHLVDHEPPIRIRTELSEGGIAWVAGEAMQVYRVEDQQLDLIHAPDEVHIDIEGFNRKVITENFNRVVCEELANHIDPTLPGKTLVFCATDAHCDLVVRLLKEAFTELYGPTDDDAVLKITGAADKPGQRIRNYKNEQDPRVAVTVDLLTTGIDVPAITNLVFLRRVRSRILYEQMMGRGTRKCDDIGKAAFRIYDAVDLYDALQPHSAMRPVVTSPTIRFGQLADELATLDDEAARNLVLEQLQAKLQRKKNRITGAHIEAFSGRAGMEVEALLEALTVGEPAENASWWAGHPELIQWLDTTKLGDGPVLIISEHEDRVIGVERGYGKHPRPEDYLDSFGTFIRENLNTLPALKVVTQRPRDLTRKQLRELKIALDDAGFTEAGLRVAWTETTNQEIAASIIGFIRQQALGSPLVPYEDRVKHAVNEVLASRRWTPPQRKWLERIGKQLLVETVVDREALDAGQFRQQGGYNRLNKIFGGEIDGLLGQISEALWIDAR